MKRHLTAIAIGTLGVGIGLAGCDTEEMRRDTNEAREDLRRETTDARDDIRSETNEVRREADDFDRSRTDARGTERPTGISAEAVSSIAQARCAREEKCGNFGPNKRYSDATDCRSNEEADLADDYDECQSIDSKELSECLSEIQNHDCNNPLDSLESVVACRESDICKSVSRM